MDERELAASNRRVWWIVGGGLGLVLLALGWAFIVGKGFGAPLQDFDSEGVARLGGEEMKQAGFAGQIAAAKVTTQGDE